MRLMYGDLKRLSLIVLALSGVIVADAQVPASPHFSLTRLADGVYAAVASDTGFAISNAGIIDLGDEVLVFDTFISPRAASDLREAAEALTGRPVRYVVNSHSHNDHVRGNQAFPGASVISTVKTRQEIGESWDEEVAWEKEHIADRIVKAREVLERGTNPARKAEDRFWLGYYNAIRDSHDSLRMVLPDLTFEGKLVLHGAQRTAELMDMGSAHTGSDLILYLPADGIVFAGDILFVRRHPYMPDGSPDGELRDLATIKALNARTVVPGHGPVGTPADIDTMAEYFHTVLALGAGLAKRNAGEQEISPVPAPFRDWWYSRFFPANLRFAKSLAGGGK